MTESVLEIVAAAGLEARRCGSEFKVVCPGPAHARGDRNPSLRVNAEKNAWRCDVCDAAGGPAQLRDHLGLPSVPSVDRGDVSAVADAGAMTALAARGLTDRSLLADLRVVDRNGGRYVAFPYRDANGRERYRKLRPLEWANKRMHVEPRGIPQVLYRLPALAELPDGGAPVIVEGEFDALALAHVGIRGVVSVPNGTGSRLDAALLHPLAHFSRIMIAVDADAAGEKLALRLAEALGPARCVRVRFEEHKDANDALRAGWKAENFAAAIAAGVPMRNGHGAAAPERKAGPAESRASVAVALIEMASRLDVFLDENARPFVRVPVEGGTATWALRSTEFRNLMRDQLYEGEHRTAGREAFDQAAGVLEARAAKRPRRTLQTRFARGEDGALWLDLCDQRWRAVRVDASGWTVVDRPPALFRRDAHQMPLPEPTTGGDARRLLALLNLASDDDGLLLLVWLATAIVPDIPHPILMLNGSQGAAKTTGAKLLRALLDPAVAPALNLKPEAAEYAQALQRHALPVLDNLTHLPQWLSDLLCQAVTGAGFEKRRLYSDDETTTFAFRRPIIMTAITVPTMAPDFLDRCMCVELSRIPLESRREEREVWAAFDQERAEILGGLLDALAGAVRIRDDLRLEGLPRMADFARWGEAVARSLGYAPDAFVRAYATNVAGVVEALVDTDPLASAIRTLAERGPWTGNASCLLAAIEGIVGERTANGKGWPGNASALGKRLVALRSPLADVGVSVSWHRTAPPASAREWTVEKRPVKPRRTEGESRVCPVLEGEMPSAQVGLPSMAGSSEMPTGTRHRRDADATPTRELLEGRDRREFPTFEEEKEREKRGGTGEERGGCGCNNRESPVCPVCKGGSDDAQPTADVHGSSADGRIESPVCAPVCAAAEVYDEVYRLRHGGWTPPEMRQAILDADQRGDADEALRLIQLERDLLLTPRSGATT